jgi:hypothetical protein
VLYPTEIETVTLTVLETFAFLCYVHRLNVQHEFFNKDTFGDRLTEKWAQTAWQLCPRSHDKKPKTLTECHGFLANHTHLLDEKTWHQDDNKGFAVLARTGAINLPFTLNALNPLSATINDR